MLIYYVTIIAVFFTSMFAQDSIIYEKIDQLYYSRKNNRFKFFALITTIILILVAGLRYKVGADYNNYIYTYEARKITWMTFVKSFDEPGIAILCKICSMIYDNSATMFFACSLITIGLYMHNIKKYSNSYIFSVIMFILCGTWAGSFGAIRQYLAAAILFAGHRYMYDRKFTKWLLVVLLAFCFHRTAIVMLPVYFIADKKINLKSIVLLIIAVLVIRYSYDFIFSFMSSFKGTNQTRYDYMNASVNIFRVLVAVVPILLYFMTYYLHKERNDKETEFYSMMLFVNATFMLATSNSAYLARTGIYTETFVVFAFPKLLNYLKFRIRRQYKLVIVSCYFLYFAYQMYASSSLNNFQWIFNHL